MKSYLSPYAGDIPRKIVWRDLIYLAEELAVYAQGLPEILAELKNLEAGKAMTELDVENLENLYQQIAKGVRIEREFILPGVNALSLQYDYFRAKVREFERKFPFKNPHGRSFVNRLSDYLFYLVVKSRNADLFTGSLPSVPSLPDQAA